MKPVFFCLSLLGFASFAHLNAQEPSSDGARFVVELKMDCPPSPELQQCMKSVPTCQSANFEEWKKAFVENMNNLILLVESGKIRRAHWSVNEWSGDSDEVTSQRMK